MNEEQIFHRAIEISSSQERLDFIEKSCGDDTALKGNVMQLLEAHDEEDFLLDHPAEIGETAELGDSHSGFGSEQSNRRVQTAASAWRGWVWRRLHGRAD